MEILKFLAPSSIKRCYILRHIRSALYGKTWRGINIQSVFVSMQALIARTAEIAEGVYIGNYVSIGDHSYIQSGSKVLSAQIGKFCSIGTNCHIGMFEHPTGSISTSSRLYLKMLNDEWYNDIPAPAILGNDVWVCSNSTIVGGIEIGDGAVVAAGAVVSHDVPPYAIVGGVPAQIIRYRFEQEKIEQLGKIAWWNWDDETIKRNKAFFEADKDELLEALQ